MTPGLGCPCQLAHLVSCGRLPSGAEGEGVAPCGAGLQGLAPSQEHGQLKLRCLTVSKELKKTLLKEFF